MPWFGNDMVSDYSMSSLSAMTSGLTCHRTLISATDRTIHSQHFYSQNSAHISVCCFREDIQALDWYQPISCHLGSIIVDHDCFCSFLEHGVGSGGFWKFRAFLDVQTHAWRPAQHARLHRTPHRTWSTCIYPAYLIISWTFNFFADMERTRAVCSSR